MGPLAKTAKPSLGALPDINGAGGATPGPSAPGAQLSPTARRGTVPKNASKMVEGLGMGGTILTAPTKNAAEPIPGNMTGTKSLLGV